MNPKHCVGCYNDFYNDGFKGTKCWSLKTAKMVWKKEVDVDQLPPWNQKAKRLPSCYRKQRCVYVEPGVIR